MSILSFIPLYVVDHFDGVSIEVAAGMLSLAYSSGLWAGPLGGYLSDHLGRVPVIIISGFIAVPAIYLLNLVPFTVGIPAILIIIGMAIHLGMPVTEAYIISNTSERRRSTVLGIYYLCSRGGPAIALLVGYLIDKHGFCTAFSTMSASIAMVAIVCALFLWGSRN